MLSDHTKIKPIISIREVEYEKFNWDELLCATP